MAPTLLRAQVSFERLSGIPADEVMNVWHFWSTYADRVDGSDEIRSVLDSFYTSIDGLMSSRLTGDYTIKVYDLLDAVPRPPFATYTESISPGTGTPLPSEVAICLSYKGPSLAGAIPARNRGRIYLGPWDASVVDSDTRDAIVDSGVRGAIATAAGTLLGSTTASLNWSVFSPTIAGAPPWTGIVLGAATAFVEGGWVDNAFDTIRSRGAEASERSTFP